MKKAEKKTLIQTANEKFRSGNIMAAIQTLQLVSGRWSIIGMELRLLEGRACKNKKDYASLALSYDNYTVENAKIGHRYTKIERLLGESWRNLFWSLSITATLFVGGLLTAPFLKFPYQELVVVAPLNSNPNYLTFDIFNYSDRERKLHLRYKLKENFEGTLHSINLTDGRRSFMGNTESNEDSTYEPFREFGQIFHLPEPSSGHYNLSIRINTLVKSDTLKLSDIGNLFINHQLTDIQENPIPYVLNLPKTKLTLLILFSILLTIAITARKIQFRQS